MCGIAGYILKSASNIHRTKNQIVLDLLEKRGPDDYGLLLSDGESVSTGRNEILESGGQKLALWHRRLSIIDLTEHGWQPMSSSDGRYHIVFNGELYNYKEIRNELRTEGISFKTESDTEVLLQAFIKWGKSCLKKFIGMFAFAFYDHQQKTIFFCRDFFGIKPLYYAFTEKGFFFGSQINVVLALGDIKPNVNLDSSLNYLNYALTDYSENTFFNEVKQLEPAHYLEINLNNVTAVQPVRYWEAKADKISKKDISFDEAASTFRDMFLKSVELHMRSDVKIGAALSGGLDSSAIVAAMKYLSGNAARVETFSFIADDPAYSEEAWVDILTSAARVDSFKTSPSSSDFFNDIQNIIKLHEEPFGSISIFIQNRVFRLAAENNIKVMLDGQGGDEILAGYTHYLFIRLASLLKSGNIAGAINYVNKCLENNPEVSFKLLSSSSFRYLLPSSFYEKVKNKVVKANEVSWLDQGWFLQNGKSILPPSSIDTRPSSVVEKLIEDLKYQILPRLLHYEDRNSMNYSIESRVPFLNPELSAFMYSLPEEYILSNSGKTKAVFRKAMQGIVPDAILNRKDKKGFAAPQRKWMTDLKPWIDEVMNDKIVDEIPFIKRKELQVSWNSFLNGDHNNDKLIWRCINYIEWYKLYNFSS